MVVWKFPLVSRQGNHMLHVPIGSVFLSTALVEDKPVAYFLVDEDKKDMVQSVSYKAIWTGSNDIPIKSTDKFLGTVVRPEGLVVHYFY